jgi:hypothetical protein
VSFHKGCLFTSHCENLLQQSKINGAPNSPNFHQPAKSSESQMLEPRWTEQEKESLREQRNSGIPWAAVQINHRSTEACKAKWKSLCGNSKQGTWTQDETDHLLEQVQGGTLPRNAMVNGRSARACEQKYNRLNHRRDAPRNGEPWTPEEDDALMNGMYMNGRTNEANQWRHNILRKREVHELANMMGTHLNLFADYSGGDT